MSDPHFPRSHRIELTISRSRRHMRPRAKGLINRPAALIAPHAVPASRAIEARLLVKRYLNSRKAVVAAGERLRRETADAEATLEPAAAYEIFEREQYYFDSALGRRHDAREALLAFIISLTCGSWDRPQQEDRNLQDWLPHAIYLDGVQWVAYQAEGFDGPAPLLLCLPLDNVVQP